MSKEKLELLDLFALPPLELDAGFGAELGPEKDLGLGEPDEYVRLDPELEDREEDAPDEYVRPEPDE